MLREYTKTDSISKRESDQIFMQSRILILSRVLNPMFKNQFINQIEKDEYFEFFFATSLNLILTVLEKEYTLDSIICKENPSSIFQLIIEPFLKNIDDIVDLLFKQYETMIQFLDKNKIFFFVEKIVSIKSNIIKQGFQEQITIFIEKAAKRIVSVASNYLNEFVEFFHKLKPMQQQQLILSKSGQISEITIIFLTGFKKLCEYIKIVESILNHLGQKNWNYNLDSIPEHSEPFSTALYFQECLKSLMSGLMDISKLNKKIIIGDIFLLNNYNYLSKSIQAALSNLATEDTMIDLSEKIKYKTNVIITSWAPLTNILMNEKSSPRERYKVLYAKSNYYLEFCFGV